MRTLGDIKTHFFLFRRMARATGVDISGMEDTAWVAAVTRCRSCGCPGICDEKLAAAELADGRLPAPPAFCENRDLLRSLQR